MRNTITLKYGLFIKLLFATIGFFSLCTSAFAYCGYKHHIDTYLPGHPLKIQSLQVMNGKVDRGFINTRTQLYGSSFDILSTRSSNHCSEKDTIITQIGFSDKDKCTLVIDDGLHLWSPEVRGIQCSGMMKYEGIFSYSNSKGDAYRLTFTA